MYVRLKNIGEKTHDLNWGQSQTVLQPGDVSSPMGEVIARKFILGNPDMVIFDEKTPEILNENIAADDAEPLEDEIPRPALKRKRG